MSALRRPGGAPGSSDFLGGALFTAAALAAALAIGAAAATRSPEALLGGFAVLVIATIALARPAVAAAAVLGLVATLPRDVLYGPSLPIGGGGLKVTDVLVALAFASWLVAALAAPQRMRLPTRSTVLLLIGFLALAGVSIANAQHEGAPGNITLIELRPLLSYLLIFPIVGAIRTVRDAERAVAVVLAACAAGSLATLYLYFSGQGSAATFAGDAQRVVDTPFLYPLMAVVWAIVLVPTSRRGPGRTATLVVASLGLAALLFTFQRGAWAALIAVAPLAIVLLPRGKRGTGLARFLPIAGIGLAVVLGVNAMAATGATNPLTSAVERLESLGQYGEDKSNQYRVAEWTTAVQEIRRHPVTGIGLGSSIEFENPLQDLAPEGVNFSQYYIHNSYIWMALKLGVIAALLFIALAVSTTVRAYRAYRRAADPRVARLLLGGFASMITLLLVSFSGPHLNIDAATPYVAATIGLIEATRRLALPRAERPT